MASWCVADDQVVVRSRSDGDVIGDTVLGGISAECWWSPAESFQDGPSPSAPVAEIGQELSGSCLPIQSLP